MTASRPAPAPPLPAAATAGPPLPGQDEIRLTVAHGRHLCHSREHQTQSKLAEVMVSFGQLGTRYVDDLWHECWGRMAPAGAHFPANSHHLVNVTGFRTFRQVVGAGSFEGITSLGLGVRAKGLPFRVFRLAGPGSHSRLVIDVANVK